MKMLCLMHHEKMQEAPSLPARLLKQEIGDSRATLPAALDADFQQLVITCQNSTEFQKIFP